MQRPADEAVTSVLASVRRAGETARAAIGGLDVTAPPEEVASRLAASAGQLAHCRSAISASLSAAALAGGGGGGGGIAAATSASPGGGGGGEAQLRYQVVRPCALPAVPAHLPEFLRTRKDAAMASADVAAEAAGAAAGSGVPEHNAAVARVTRAYEAAAGAALAAMRAEHAALAARAAAAAPPPPPPP